MATRPKTTPTVTTDPVTPDPLADLRAQKKALDDQIKALKITAQPKRDLAAEIARQEATPNKAMVYTIQAAVRQRVQRGQPAEDAVAGVLHLCERIAREALVGAEGGDSDGQPAN